MFEALSKFPLKHELLSLVCLYNINSFCLLCFRHNICNKLFSILSVLAGNTQNSSRQSSQALTGKVSFFFIGGRERYECFMIIITINWASMRENLSLGFANNKGADQPARSRSLISTFVIRFLESILSKLATSKFSIF